VIRAKRLQRALEKRMDVQTLEDEDEDAMLLSWQKGQDTSELVN
jgi:hypothetical protein